MLKKYSSNKNTNQDTTYYNDMINLSGSFNNMNSMIRNQKMDSRIINSRNEKVAYMRNPMRNDSAMNFNMNRNSSDSINKINSTKINSNADSDKLGIIKNFEINSTNNDNGDKTDINKSSSKYLESEESNNNNNYNKIILNNKNFNNRLKKNLKLTNYNNYNNLNIDLTNKNLGVKGNFESTNEKDFRNLFNYNNSVKAEKIFNKNFNYQTDFSLNLVAEQENNLNLENGSMKNEESKYSKLKNFYAKNNLGMLKNLNNISAIDSNIINNSNALAKAENEEISYTENTPINKIGKTSFFTQSKISPLLVPISNKYSNNKSIYYNRNLDNSVHTPTKLFQLTNLKGENILIKNNNNKKNEVESNVECNSLLIKNLKNSRNKNIDLNEKNYSNFISNNTIKYMNTRDSYSFNKLNTSKQKIISKDYGDYKKIIIPKIRIVSRNNVEKTLNLENYFAEKNTKNEASCIINETFVNKTTNNNNINFEFNKERSSGNSNVNLNNKNNKLKNCINENNQIAKANDNSDNNFFTNQKSNKIKNEDKNKKEVKIHYAIQNTNNISVFNNDNYCNDSNFNHGNLYKNVNFDNNQIDSAKKNKNIYLQENLKELIFDKNTLEKKVEKLDHLSNNHLSNKESGIRSYIKDKISNYDNPKNNSSPIEIIKESKNSLVDKLPEDNNIKKNYDGLIIHKTKDVMSDVNDSNIVCLNKSSKCSSQKDIIITDSNENEEIDISGKLISIDNSNTSLIKKNSTKNSLKEKPDDFNNLKINSHQGETFIKENKGSNFSLKNNFLKENNTIIDSKVTILDINSFKNSNVNSKQKIGLESEKEILTKDITKEEKFNIDNLIKNLQVKNETVEIAKENNSKIVNYTIKVDSHINDTNNSLNTIDEKNKKDEKNKNDKSKNIINKKRGTFGMFKQVKFFLRIK